MDVMLEDRAAREAARREAAAKIKRILVVSCSAAKVALAPGAKVPALDLYDGPVFQLLRGMRPLPDELGVWILSAQHGLIRGDFPIERYNEVLTPARAAVIIGETQDRLTKVIARHPYADDLFVFGGKLYRQLVRLPNIGRIRPGMRVQETSGGSYKHQLWELKAWLSLGLMLPLP